MVCALLYLNCGPAFATTAIVAVGAYTAFTVNVTQVSESPLILFLGPYGSLFGLLTSA